MRTGSINSPQELLRGLVVQACQDKPALDQKVPETVRHDKGEHLPSRRGSYPTVSVYRDQPDGSHDLA